MVQEDAPQPLVSGQTEAERLLHVAAGGDVLAEPELAQAAQRPAPPLVRLQGDEAAEGVAALPEAVPLVADRAEGPPALGPARTEADRLAVEPGRVLEPPGLARLGGAAGERVEGRRRGRGRLGPSEDGGGQQQEGGGHG